jgi:aminoglycoside phosphotransferase (APT) family kinase protein
MATAEAGPDAGSEAYDTNQAASTGEADGVAEAVGAWLERVHGLEAVELEDLHAPAGTGFSSETFLGRLRWRDAGGAHEQRIVLRAVPRGHRVFERYDLGVQVRCLRALESTDVPVPRVRWAALEDSPLGRPFYVMDHVEGRIPSDNPPYPIEGWLHDAPAAEQREICHRSLEVLGRLHGLDPERVGLGDLGRIGMGSGVRGQLEAWRSLLAWGRRGEQPTLDAAFDWLERHLPSEQEPSVITWGDARVSNIVYDGVRPVALLDWEMAALGPPEVDVGWFLTMDRQLSEGIGFARLEGFADRDAQVAVYEEAAGRRLGDLTWYEVFAGVRFAVTLMRVAQRVILDGHLPEDADEDRNNMATRLVASMLDLPSPGEPGLFA